MSTFYFEHDPPMIHSKQGTLERATSPKGMTWFEEAFKETEGIDFKQLLFSSVFCPNILGFVSKQTPDKISNGNDCPF